MSTIRARLKSLAQRGQGTIEYLGIGVLISVLIAALVTFPIGDAIGKGLRGVVCQITHAASPSSTLDGTNNRSASPAPALAATVSTPDATETLAGDCPLAPENAGGKAETKSAKGKSSDSKTADKNSGKSKGSGNKSGSRGDSKKDSSKSGKKDGPVKGDPVNVSPQGFDGPFVKGEDGYVYDSDGNRVPYSNKKRRPEYGEGQVEEVWKQSRDQQLKDIKNGDLEVDQDGFVPTKLEKDEIYVIDVDGNWRSVKWEPGQSRGGKWDMGHREGHEYRKTYKDYMSGKISKEEFLKTYQDPKNYKVEDPKRNQSHVDEDKSDQ